MTTDPLARFRGPDGVIPDDVNIERELDLEAAEAERPDTDDEELTTAPPAGASLAEELDR